MLLSPFGGIFLSIIIQHCREELKEIKEIPICTGDVAATDCIYTADVGSLLP
jgi:hypothetical protein